MVSRIDPFLKQFVRHAEGTDTRQDIRKDESKIHGAHKDGAGSGEYSPMLWEDTTAVSVSALKMFLQNILAASEGHDETPVEAPVISPETQAAPMDVSRQKAMNAYQTTARATGTVSTPAAAPPPPRQEGEITADLRPEDIALIRQFIADLTMLEEKGVQQVEIERSQTFLEGVREAIATAKILYGL